MREHLGSWRTPLTLAVLLALLALSRVAGGYIPAFKEWVGDLGFWGPLVFVVGYGAAVVVFVPGALLTLAGGAIFGVVRGTLYVFVAATLGACLAFLVSRYLARPAVERRFEGNARFAAIDRAVGEQGRRIVFLLRLSPVFPFVLLNYALGLTRVRFVDYLVASIGMLPGTLLYVYSGTLAGDVASVAGGAGMERGAAGWVLRVVGLVATVIVTVMVTRIARRALAEATGEES